jgi:hypothetical protein
VAFRFAYVLIHNGKLPASFRILAAFVEMTFVGRDYLFFQHEKGGAHAVTTCRKIEIGRFRNKNFIAERFDEHRDRLYDFIILQ